MLTRSMFEPVKSAAQKKLTFDSTLHRYKWNGFRLLIFIPAMPVFDGKEGG